MSFSFGMYYKPDYQKRYGTCKICHQGIVNGAIIMIGAGFFHGQIVRNHNHYNCWLAEVQTRASEWFFANQYKPKRMSPDKKAELNRLRAKRHYIKKKGGNLDGVAIKVAEINERIAFVKAG